MKNKTLKILGASLATLSLPVMGAGFLTPAHSATVNDSPGIVERIDRGWVDTNNDKILGDVGDAPYYVIGIAIKDGTAKTVPVTMTAVENNATMNVSCVSSLGTTDFTTGETTNVSIPAGEEVQCSVNTGSTPYVATQADHDNPGSQLSLQTVAEFGLYQHTFTTFVVMNNPTPMPSPSASPSASDSASPTADPSASDSATPTTTPTASDSATDSPTTAPSDSSSPTDSPSSSTSASATPTDSASPSVDPSATTNPSSDPTTTTSTDPNGNTVTTTTDNNGNTTTTTTTPNGSTTTTVTDSTGKVVSTSTSNSASNPSTSSSTTSSTSSSGYNKGTSVNTGDVETSQNPFLIFTGLSMFAFGGLLLKKALKKSKKN